MRPDKPARIPGVSALRRRRHLALVAAILLVPIVALVRIQLGLEAALGAAALVAALLVLSWTSRETLSALEEIEKSSGELRALEERWQFALESAGHGVFDWNPRTGHVYRSDVWHRTLGYSREEAVALDERWAELVHPEDRAIAREFRTRLSGGEHRSAEAEYRLRHASGQWRWVLSRGTVFGTDANGRPERIIGTTTDLTEFKAARAQAQDSVGLFRAMFEESAYPMLLAGVTDRRISMVNRAAKELFHRPAADLVGHTATELGLFANSERFADQLRTDGRVRDFLTQVGNRSMLIFGDVLRLHGEKMCLIYGVDVSDRERSVASERSVHELQRALFEHSPLPMAVLAADDLRIVDVNQAALDCFGYTRAETIGRNSAELHIWAEAGAHEQHLAALREVGRISGVDRRVRTRNGIYRDMQLSAELIEAGGQRLVLVQFTDVTQRRQAERQAAQVTSFYAALSEILEVGSRARDEDEFLAEVCRICVARTGNHIAFAAWVDADGRTARVRGQAGDKAATYLDKLQIVLAADDPRGWGPVGRAVRSGQPFICNDEEDSALEPWRERIAAVGTRSLCAQPLSQGGRVVGAICLHHPHRDAYDAPTAELVGRIAMSASRTLDKLAYERERKRAQAELARNNEDLDLRVRERTRELQTTMQELESFSYSVAHDLRAPLRAINAYLQLGADPATPPGEAREFLGKAAASVAGLAELIDDLLEFARAGRRSLDRSLVDMDGLARGVAETLQPLYPGTRIVVHPLPPVAGDAFLLRQVLHNLIENALKFSRRAESPRVELRAEEGERSYVYRVHDNGVGFDMKYSENIFGVFHRLHDARDFDGTGVGLAIVKRIVERHQGRVWCDSRPGGGATFSLSLAAPDPRVATIPQPQPADHGNPAR